MSNTNTKKGKNNIEKDILVKMTDPGPFKTLIDVIKEFLSDVIIEFIRDPEKEMDNVQKTEEELAEELKEVKIAEDNAVNTGKKKSLKKKMDAKIDNADNETEKKEEEGEKKKKTFRGMKMVAVNKTGSLIVVVKLSSSKFETYKIKKDVYDVGINLPSLFKLIKTVEKDDVMTISIDSDEKQKLCIEVDNEKSKTRTVNKITTMDIDKNSYNIPNIEFEMVITMSSQRFHEICKSLSHLSEYMDIVCKEKSITFTSTGDCYSKVLTIEGSDSDSKDVDVVRIKPREPGKGTIVQGVFELKYFTMFQKCAVLCQQIQIFFKNDSPIFIRYLVSSNGHILVGIVPVSENISNAFEDEDDEEEEDDDEEGKVENYE